MAPPVVSDRPSGDGGLSQQSSNVGHHGRDVLDDNTKRFEAMIEARDKVRKPSMVVANKPSKIVRGGLPPHLLRQSQQGIISDNLRISSAEQVQPQLVQSQQAKPSDLAARPSRPYEFLQHQAETLGSDARGKIRPPLDYGPNKDFGGPLPPVEDALHQQREFQSQQFRPQPGPTPPQAHDAYEGQLGPSQVMHQHKSPPTPTYPGVMPDEDDTTMFTRAKDNPSNNPRMVGIMNSKWATAQRVFTPFHERQEQRFAKLAQEDASRIQQISPVPQHKSSAPRQMSSVPHQRQSSALGLHDGVRVFVTPFQHPVNAVEQRGVNCDTQPSTALQPKYNVPPPEKKQKWRPKNSVDLESQSLPSTVSSVELNDDEEADLRDLSNDGPVGDDVRGRIADDMDLARKRNGEGFYNKKEYIKKFQTEEPEQEEDDDGEAEFRESWRPSYCQRWVWDLPNELPPIAFFMGTKVERSEECDVQTLNGFLMPPVDYPDTHPNPENLKNTRSQEVRRLSASATLKTAADYEKSKRRLEKSEMKAAAHQAMIHGPRWKPVTDPFPAPQLTAFPNQGILGGFEISSGAQAQVGHPNQTHNASQAPRATQTQIHNAALAHVAQTQAQNVTQARYYNAAHIGHLAQPQAHHPAHAQPQGHTNNPTNQTPTEHVAQDSHSEPDGDMYLRVQAHMRPAEQRDLAQVLNIYNWEVSHGIQALDNKPIVLRDMQQVFSECKRSKTPFIVAIAGTPAEAAARKEIPAPPRHAYPPTHPHIIKPEQDKVLGFGLVKIRSTGLAGDTNDSVGRFQGQAYFYVANEGRKKGIGRAILHKLVSSCSSYAIARERCDFYDPERSPDCDNAPFNARNYSRLFIETAVRSKGNSDSLWLSKLLDEYHFLTISTMDNYRRVGNDEHCLWLDNIVWQHECQDKESIRENRPGLK